MGSRISCRMAGPGFCVSGVDTSHGHQLVFLSTQAANLWEVARKVAGFSPRSYEWLRAEQPINLMQGRIWWSVREF